MAKEIKGWREDPTPIAKGTAGALLELCTSDDGWLCPHCGCKKVLDDSTGITNDAYVNLMEEFNPVELNCYDCNKAYFIKAAVVRKYYSCADAKFEEREE